MEIDLIIRDTSLQKRLSKKVTFFDLCELFYVTFILSYQNAMRVMRYTFPKSEHLKSLKQIQKLIQKGKVIRRKGIKLIWLKESHSEQPDGLIKAGFSVPKRNFKRAVHRNRIRRKMKEVVRYHKDNIAKSLQAKEQILFLIVYTYKGDLSYQELEAEIISAFHELSGSLEKGNTS